MDAASEEYIRDKGVHHLLNDIVSDLVRDKPNDVLAYLGNHLPKMKTKNVGKRPVMEGRYPASLDEKALTIVVLGASGDLAKKKTFPALFQLYAQGLLPSNVSIVGYARSEMTSSELCKKIEPTLSQVWEPSVMENFFVQISYCRGGYDSQSDFSNLNKHIQQLESAHSSSTGNRLFYLALPPAVFLGACGCIKGQAMAAEPSWTRVIVEKPFGRDTDSSRALSKGLNALLNENQIFRIDHYLGKEMVQNLITMRFANKTFAHVWDKSCISSVQITFKETIGTQGRGGYFDSSGIIRDVLQNHLLQIVALIAMEKPKSLEAEHVRDEKVSVLSQIRECHPNDVVLGQYTASEDGKEPGYLDDKTVPPNSNTPTFAQTTLWVDNDRWDGVPFILKASKAVERKEVTIRLQFKPEIRPFGNVTRNELVVRLQPNEAMYMKVNAKEPGMTNQVHTTELDLTYHTRYDVTLPDAYESLIYEAVVGNTTNFVRSDELDAAWKIYTPLLHKIDAGEIKSQPYAFGSRGPPDADKVKYQYYVRGDYEWNGKK